MRCFSMAVNLYINSILRALLLGSRNANPRAQDNWACARFERTAFCARAPFHCKLANSARDAASGV
jgi:hypothetical protein